MSKIEFTLKTPYIFEGVKVYDNDKNLICEDENILMCRCGKSKQKPFCSGEHLKIGFVGKRENTPLNKKERIKKYMGDGFNVLDDRSLCCHSGNCDSSLPNVYNTKKHPWIHPDEDNEENNLKAVKKCPSSALGFEKDGEVKTDYFNKEEAYVIKNGPIHIKGKVDIEDDQNSKEELNDAKDHYALCRCGGSKNKPFCDGEHYYNGFDDSK